jgi:hypothetical protein
MQMKINALAIGIALLFSSLLLACVHFLVKSSVQKQELIDLQMMQPPVIGAPVPPLTTTPATTTAAPKAVDDDSTDISNIRVGGMTVLYPRVPLMEFQYNPRRWELVPGAIIPGMDGRRIEDATHVITTTYPGVTVRVVPHTDPLGLEVRRDRVTLSVDLYTKRVIAARIG